MLPVLKVAGDDQEHRIGDIIDQLAREFGLTEEERNQSLPSGKQSTFANRVHWAKTYLVQAGLLRATKRAHFRITDRGRGVLAKAHRRLTTSTFSSFQNSLTFAHVAVLVSRHPLRQLKPSRSKLRPKLQTKFSEAQ
jgi:restriction system protein